MSGIIKLDYKDLTKEKIEEALKEFFGSDDNKYKEEYAALRAKVLSGWFYSIGSGQIEHQEGVRKMMVHTGQGGVLAYIDACEKHFSPADEVAKTIFVSTTNGWITLYDLKVVKKTKNEQSEPSVDGL